MCWRGNLKREVFQEEEDCVDLVLDDIDADDGSVFIVGDASDGSHGGIFQE